MEGLTPEQKAFMDGLNNSITELKAQVADKATKENTDANKAEMALLKEQLEAAKVELEATKTASMAQGEKINEMAEQKASQVRIGSYADQIRKHIEDNKEQFEAFKARKANSFSFDLVEKAVGNMTVAGSVSPDAINVASTSVASGLIDILPVEPLIESYCNTGGTDSANIIYVEKTNREGSTIFIGEGDAKNQIDFVLTKSTSTAKKVADYIKVSDEMLDDIQFMAAAIEGELRYEINYATSGGILAGDGTGDNLDGITSYALAYALTTVLTTTPNLYDVIRAAATQIKINNGRATHVFLNPIDYTNMGISKGTTGYYVIIDGMVTMLPYLIVESNEITVGQILVGDMSKAIVRNYKPFTVEYGYDSDDFTKNMVTVRGERRLHAYCASNHYSCFVYDAISDIVTAITTP